ncbi:MAG: folE, partial [Thermomicrobiales bacterium]|nr:folE [Thermomicrobiales bacterium]
MSIVELANGLEKRETGEETDAAMIGLHRRDVSDDQLRRFEQYAAEMFSAFGMELDSPATVDTPRRFVRALLDATAGYEGDPKLLTVFET